MKQLFEITTKTQKPDRYFVGQIDSRPTIFVLHGDNSITVTPVAPELCSIEPAENVIGSFRGLAGLN